MRSSAVTAGVVCTAVAALSACAGGPDTGGSAARESQTLAVLFVERAAADPAGAHVGARFVQFAGLPGDALPDLLGTPYLPPPAGSPPACAERADATAGMDTSHAEAHLLDVGTIDVRAGDTSVRLEPRRFPDLWNVVSGVTYAADMAPASDWHFTVSGDPAAHTPAFEVDAQAPEPMTGFSVADQAIAAGGTASIPRRPFGVRWNRGDAGDAVLVVFEGVDNPRPIVCAARDEGSLEIDATWAERLADIVRNGGSVVAHRVRVREITVPSVDSTSVVFDLTQRMRVQGS